MNMEMFRSVAVGLISFAAVLSDLRMKRIPNVLIITGLLLAGIYQVLKWRMLGSIFFFGGVGIPVLLLGGLYYFRMIGAGDVKLFAVLGGFLGVRDILPCMLTAFLAGGILSVVLMLLRKNLKERFLYFGNYVTAVIGSQSWRPYRTAETGNGEFCFSIPVFVSVLCWLGGRI